MVDEELPDWDPPDVSIVEGEWNPRALKLLKEGRDFAKYKAEGVFRFLHLFSRPKDVLKGALESEAKKEGIRIQVESFDKLDSGDLAADQPYLGLMEELDEVDGSHCGFPCGSFRMVKEGGVTTGET